LDKTITQKLILTNIERLDNSNNGNPNFKLTFESKKLRFENEIFTQDDHNINNSISSDMINKPFEVTFKANKEKTKLLLDNLNEGE